MNEFLVPLHVSIMREENPVGKAMATNVTSFPMSLPVEDTVVYIICSFYLSDLILLQESRVVETLSDTRTCTDYIGTANCHSQKPE